MQNFPDLWMVLGVLGSKSPRIPQVGNCFLVIAVLSPGASQVDRMVAGALWWKSGETYMLGVLDGSYGTAKLDRNRHIMQQDIRVGKAQSVVIGPVRIDLWV